MKTINKLQNKWTAAILLLFVIAAFQYSNAKKAKGAYISLGTLNSAYNISDNTLNTQTNTADTPGVTIYGSWENYNGVQITNCQIYVDSKLYGSYYPGCPPIGNIQYGIATASLINGSHTTYLMGSVYDPTTGNTNTGETNLLTFYVYHNPPQTTTLSISRAPTNGGTFSSDAYDTNGDIYGYKITGGTSISDYGTKQFTVPSSSSGAIYTLTLTAGLHSIVSNAPTPYVIYTAPFITTTCITGQPCSLIVPYITPAVLQVQ